MNRRKAWKESCKREGSKRFDEDSCAGNNEENTLTQVISVAHDNKIVSVIKDIARVDRLHR